MVEDTVVWTPNGVDPVNPEHAHYLETFGLTFKKMLIAQIDTAMKQAADERIDNKMSQEVIRHMYKCKALSQCFFGQSEVVHEIHRMMTKPLRGPATSTGEEKEEEE